MTLFEQVVAASGLSAVLGPGVIHRACERAGFNDSARLHRHELLRAMPEIEQALATYLTPEEVKERVAAILQLTRSSSGLLNLRLDDEKLDED